MRNLPDRKKGEDQPPWSFFVCRKSGTTDRISAGECGPVLVRTGKDEKKMRKCTYCGMILEDDDLFCVQCGKPVKLVQKNAESGGSGKGERRRSGTGMRYVDTEAAEPADRRRIFAIGLIVLCLALAGVLCILLLRTGRKAGSPEEIIAAAGSDGEGQDSGEAAVLPDDLTETEQAQAPAREAVTVGGQEETQDPETGGDAAEREAAERERAEREKAEKEKAEKEEAEREKAEKEKAEKEKAEKEQAEKEKAEKEKAEKEKAEKERAEKEKKEKEEAKKKAATDSSYLLPESDSRYYTYEELNALDDASLQLAINEIYARHGRIFESESIRTYFENKTWYNGTIAPENFDGNEGAYFNSCESANRELLVQIRNSRTAAYQQPVQEPAQEPSTPGQGREEPDPQKQSEEWPQQDEYDEEDEDTWLEGLEELP